PVTRSPIRCGRPTIPPRRSSPANGSRRCCKLFEAAQKSIDVSGRGFDRLHIVRRERPVEEAVSGARIKLNLDIAVAGGGSGDRAPATPGVVLGHLAFLRGDAPHLAEDEQPRSGAASRAGEVAVEAARSLRRDDDLFGVDHGYRSPRALFPQARGFDDLGPAL